MHGHYRPPAMRSKLAHYAVCSIRPIIINLMIYYHATLAIILLSSSVCAIVHSIEISYFVSF